MLHVRGGMKESGIGRENGLEAFEACKWLSTVGELERLLAFATDTQSKSTIVNIATAEETRKSDDWFADTEEVRRYG